MPKAKLKNITVTLTATAILLASMLIFTNAVSGQASIAMANYYPDNTTYASIDHFTDQTTAVNTNTTVSVSIDGDTPIPMTYQGVIYTTVPGDTIARDWHTWQATVPPITTPGNHTFQFFRHYYVWQAPDQYWAEFNSYSDIHSFNIGATSATSSPTPSPPPTANSSYLLAAIIAVAVAFSVLVMLVVRSHVQRRSLNEQLPVQSHL